MSDSLKEVVEAQIAVLQDNKSALGLKDIYYGDERQIPRTPAVAVVPDGKSRDITETGHMTINTFTLFFLVYHSKLESVQVTRRECDELAEQIESVLHQDKRLGGRLYTSHVTSLTPGYLTRNRVVMQATRITWQGRSKTRV